MKTIRLILLGGLLLCSLPVTAETLRGQFVQERFLQGFDQPVRSEGSFLLVPGQGLVWRGETPFPVVTVITPTGIVQSVDGQETLRLSSAKLPFLARLYDMLGGAMAGDWNALAQDFAIVREDTPSGTRITLTPLRTGEAQPFRALSFRVVRFVEEVTVEKPDGDRDHLLFREQSLSAAPPTPAERTLLDSSR